MTNSNRPYIKAMLERQLTIIQAKAQDYAANDDPHSNFKYSSFLACPFPDQYKSYAILIGTKLARLSELLQGKEPKHESIQDSFDDLANYVALFAERVNYYEKNEKDNENRTKGPNDHPSIH